MRPNTATGQLRAVGDDLGAFVTRWGSATEVADSGSKLGHASVLTWRPELDANSD